MPKSFPFEKSIDPRGSYLPPTSDKRREATPVSSSLTLSSPSGRGSFQIAAVTHDQEGGLEAVIDLQFVEDIGKVRFYVLFTYKNLFVDLLVCQPLSLYSY